MWRRVATVAWFAVGCGPDERAPVPDHTVLDTVCAPRSDNPLRVDCVTTSPSGAGVEVRYRWVGDDLPWTELSLPPADVHPFTLIDLPAGGSVELEVTDGTGTTSDVLAIPEPSLFAGLEVTVRAPVEETAIERMLLTIGCGDMAAIAVLDGWGRVTWYEDLSDEGDGVSAFSHVPGGVLVAPSVLRVLEIAWDGTERRRWESDVLVEPVQHELIEHDGLTWMLTAASWTAPIGLDYIDDGVLAYDADGALVHAWHVSETRDMTVYGWEHEPGTWQSIYPHAYDALHANALTFDEAGRAWVSFRTTSEVLVLDPAEDGGPGDVAMQILGDGTGDVVPDTAFMGQHHLRVQDGVVSMFDNVGLGEVSRGLSLAVDGDAATTVEEVVYDRKCTVGGSWYPVGDHVLLTCGEQNVVAELSPEGEVLREIELGCADSRPLYRAIPLGPLSGE